MALPATRKSKDGANGAVADRRSRLVRGLVFAIVGLGVLFVLFAAAGLYLYSLSRSLPEIDVASGSLKAARTSVVYAADGTVLAEWHGEQDRHVVKLDAVAEPMREAVVAIEDPRFYEHEGVDWSVVLRPGGGTQRSTITRQLVKLLFPKGERTLVRKVREVLLAYEIETRTDKDHVLETYLNLVYFGHGAYGVESAARTYFGKSAAELTLPEAAMLAGVVRSPARYSPREDPAAAKLRRDLVLSRMREQGVIDASEEAAARETAVATVPPKDVAPVAPYFVEYVKQDLLARLGADAVYRGGLRVRTTLDPGVQKAAEDAVSRVLGRKGDPGAALVTLDAETGHVLAMIGGRDFRTDQFNLAAQGKRQPGSAFKPFVLVAALEQGVSPDRVFDATPYRVRVKDGVWNVDNYENAATAPSVTLRAATAWSVNAVYARLVMEVGPQRVVEAAKRMGITSPLDADPAIALGGLRYGVSPLEMASAYSTIANGGTRNAPVAIERVTDPEGRVVYQPDARPMRVLDTRTAQTASDMLREVVERGTATAAGTGRWAAGKTGTTQSYRDAWFVGWGDGLTTAVWVGYPKGQVAMTDVHGIKVTGGSYPALIWNAMMMRAPLPSQPAVRQAAEGAPRLVRVCADTMLVAGPRCPNVVEMYLPASAAPSSTCTRHR